MRTSSSALTACARIAGKQHGVISAAQAVDVGVPRTAIRRLVRTGQWTRVRPSVYALWVPTSGQWLQRVTAASLWLAKAGAVSHRAAATLLGLDGLRGAPIELTTTGRHRSSDEGTVLHHVPALDRADVVVRDGIRVTSAARTLVDLCAVVTPRIVDMALDSALRLGLTRIDDVRSALASSELARPRARVLERLLDEHPGTPTDSVLEMMALLLVQEGGLPTPHRQFPVVGGSGVVYRIDLAYPKQLVAIEADGRAFHSSRRDWQRDRRRQNELIRLGWRVYRVTWEDVSRRPRQVVSDVAALLSTQNVPARDVLGRR